MLRTYASPVSSTPSYSWPAAVRSRSWQEEAIAAYRQAEHTDIDRRRQELASQIFELTGQPVEAGAIYVDAGTRNATVALGDRLFQVLRGELFLVRPCVHCGVGRFASSPIECAADLGHALAVWEPRCAGCALDDEDEDWSHSF